MQMTSMHDFTSSTWDRSMKSINETWNQIPNKSHQHKSKVFLHERSVQCIKGVAGISVPLDRCSAIRFLLRTRKQRNQTSSVIKRLRELSRKKKPKRTEPRRPTLQLWTWLDVHQQKAQQDNSVAISAMCSCFLNSDNVGMAQYEPVHQCMPIPARQATSQYLRLMSKSNSPTPVKMITWFVNWSRLKVRRNH